MTAWLGRYGALAAIGAAWAASLALPAIAARGAPVLSGLDVLVDGWQGASRGVLAWYANPLFVAAFALAACGFRRACGVLSGLGLVLALTSFAASDVLESEMRGAPDVTLEAGFFVWLVAFVALFLWSWIGVYSRHRKHFSAAE